MMTFSSGVPLVLLSAAAILFLSACERGSEPSGEAPASVSQDSGNAVAPGHWKSPQPDPRPEAADGHRKTPESRAALADRLADRSSRVWGVVEHWQAERQAEAVAALLDLAASETAPADWRLYDVSEDEFIKLPTAELETHKSEMMASYQALRGALSNLVAQAREDLSARRIDRLGSVLKVLDQVATANQGASVTLLAGMHGRVAQQAAERLRAAIVEAGLEVP